MADHPQPIRRPRAVTALIVLHVVLSVGAIGGALPLIVDPSGGLMGVPLAALDGLPFRTFLVPAIALLVMIGIVPAVVAFGLLRPHSMAFLERLNPLRRWRWPFAASLFVGVYLIGWTVGEMMLWGWVWLSAFYCAWGIATVWLALSSPVRRALTVS